jgi:hypothetical protein
MNANLDECVSRDSRPGIAIFAGAGGADAQEGPRRVALKNGETVELHTVWYVVNCKSMLVGSPTVVLDGPKEVSLTIKEGPVIPRRLNCANPVAGGTLMATAKDVKVSKEAKLVYKSELQDPGR